MITKKQLLKRIKSLEEKLGLVYKAPDDKKDYEEHVQDSEYGFVGNTNRFKEWYKRKLTKKEQDNINW